MQSNETTEWIPLSITYVLYPKGDIIGQLLAVLSLTPFGVVVAFLTLTLFMRDIHVILFFVGQLSNEVLCLSLKRLMGESRPVQIAGVPHSNKSYGMPSQHSQFQTFFTVYCLLFVINRLTRQTSYFKALIIVTSITLCTAVIYSRIYLLYHYWSQCFAGVVIGALFALFWYSVINFIVEPFLFDYILNLKISGFLGLRSVYIEPVITIRKKKRN